MCVLYCFTLSSCTVPCFPKTVFIEFTCHMKLSRKPVPNGQAVVGRPLMPSLGGGGDNNCVLDHRFLPRLARFLLYIYFLLIFPGTWGSVYGGSPIQALIQTFTFTSARKASLCAFIQTMTAVCSNQGWSDSTFLLPHLLACFNFCLLSVSWNLAWSSIQIQLLSLNLDPQVEREVSKHMLHCFRSPIEKVNFACWFVHN